MLHFIVFQEIVKSINLLYSFTLYAAFHCVSGNCQIHPFAYSLAPYIVFQGMVMAGFDFLFDLPSTTTRNLPLCKSPASRSACFDLLIEVCKGNPENYIKLQRLLLSQHRKGQ